MCIKIPRLKEFFKFLQIKKYKLRFQFESSEAECFVNSSVQSWPLRSANRESAAKNIAYGEECQQWAFQSGK